MWMDNADLINRCEWELDILEKIGDVPTRNLKPDNAVHESILKLVNDYNTGHRNRVNQLRLILSILKKAGDTDGD